ncbi:MAG: N-6 DNA methylase, partial [Promethearchaeota archaeon]
KVAEGISNYVLFFTIDYSIFWVAIIVDDGIVDEIFIPSNPSPLIERFIDGLTHKRIELDQGWIDAAYSHSKHILTASRLVDAIYNKDQNKLKKLLKRGLGLALSSPIIIPRENSVLKQACLEVDLSLKENEINEWISSNLGRIISLYESQRKKELKIIVVIGETGISYLSSHGTVYGSILYPEDEKSIISLFTTIITCFDIRVAFNADVFKYQFGTYSPFFIKSRYIMEQYLAENQIEIKIVKEEWKRFFGKVYQSEDLDDELFIKHSYLSLIIKNVLFCKYLPKKIVKNAQSLIELSEYFDQRGVKIFFNDFYAWANNISEIREDIFNSLRDAQYETEDIFHIIYQDMVSPSTRHALGEFYTPPEMARLMVEESYKPGMIVLDPSCGSGTFIVEIVSQLKQSQLSRDKVIKAISRIYGFDVNPIAILVSKANLLLHLEDLEIPQIPVNIFLTDSLFPIKKKKFKDVLWGSCETFIMGNEIIIKRGKNEVIKGTVGELNINTRFFQKENISEFSKYLRFIDEKITTLETSDEIIQKFNTNFCTPWLDESISSTPHTYRENIHEIIRILVNLHKKKEDNIWLYLLYNSLGPYILMKNVDLIIGNPPWVVYYNINSKTYQEQCRKLSEFLRIKPKAHQIANLELATLFFYGCANNYLKEGGTIFLILTSGVISGDHCEKFRYLSPFSNIQLWCFDQIIFPVPHYCIKASYTKDKNEDLEKKLPIPLMKYHIEIDENGKILFTKIKEENLIPFFYDKKKKYAKRYISDDVAIKSLNYSEKSYYYPFIYRGATIFPKSLVFIRVTKEQGDLSTIETDPNETKLAKGIWKQIKIENETVESKYLFNCITSKQLYPFIVNGNARVFLPVDNELNFDDDLAQNALRFYNKINKIFNTNKKKGSQFNSIFERINYHNVLSNNSQRGNFKVIYNALGKNVKAAVLIGRFVVDQSCMLASFRSKMECYYVCAFLNSPLLKDAASIIASDRNLIKRPISFNFPKFDENNEMHIRLANLAISCENIIKAKVVEHKFSEKKIINLIEEKLTEINEVLKKILRLKFG